MNPCTIAADNYFHTARNSLSRRSIHRPYHSDNGTPPACASRHLGDGSSTRRIYRKSRRSLLPLANPVALDRTRSCRLNTDGNLNQFDADCSCTSSGQPEILPETMLEESRPQELQSPQ